MGCTSLDSNDKKPRKQNKSNNNLKVDNLDNKKINNKNSKNITKEGEELYNEILKEINQKKNKNNKEEDDDEILKEINQMNNKKYIDELKDKLESLYKSYYEAKTYFYSNDLKEKELDAIQKIKKIISAQELLKKGEYKKINMDELPKEINSEYITGYSKEERKNKFDNIINKLKEEKENAKKNKDKKLEEIKIMTKNIKKENIEKFKQDSKKLLDEEINKINEKTKEIELMNELLQDEYIPVPDYIMQSEEYKIEKINEDIPENIMRISVSNLTYTKSNPIIVLILNIDDNEIKKEIKGKTKEEINETFDWTLNEKIFRNIIRNKIDLILGRSYLIKKDKVKGAVEISLRNFRNRDLIEERCKIKMISGKPDNYIDISIKIRSSIIEKDYDTDYRDVIKITRIYPKFNINGDNYIHYENNNNNEETKQNTVSINKVLSEIEMQNTKIIVENKNNKGNINKYNQKIENKINYKNIQENKDNKLNINNNKNDLNGNNQKIDRNLFKEEELIDVDCIDNLNSLNVLKDRLKKLEIVIAKIDGRTPRNLMQKKIKINCKIKSIEKQMQEGEFEPKDYLLLMEHQLAHDVLLCKYLKQENQLDKAKDVYSRINLLNEEIKELKAYIK